MNNHQYSRRNLLIAAAAILALTTGGWLLWKRHVASEVTYREIKVERGPISVTILSTGTVQPENRLEIKSPIAGRAEQVLTKEGDHVRRGQVLAWMSSTERAALLDAARAKGADELKRWEDLYRPTPILAPIAGTVIARNVEAGQSFTATDAILVMSDRLTVKAQVDETDIAQIQLKQEALIVLDAYPGKKVRARVDQVAFEAKTINNVTNYIVDVLPLEAPEYMRSGMTANVTFELEAKPSALLVPADSIQNGRDSRSTVLVRDATNGLPVEREIVLGITDGKRTEVVSGLSEGDVVLIAQARKGSGAAAGSNPFSPVGGGRPRTGGAGRGR